MRDAVLRWGRRIAPWILPGLLGLVLVVGILDEMWYRFCLPQSFWGANWYGSWRTVRYGGMAGRLTVRLPDPLPVDTEFKADALVYYPIWFGYRTGQFVKFEFRGQFTPDGTAAGATPRKPLAPPAGRAAAPVEPIGFTKTGWEVPGKGGNLKFRATLDGQELEYSALLDEHGSRIVGGYLSRSPDDYGQFYLRND